MARQRHVYPPLDKANGLPAMNRTIVAIPYHYHSSKSKFSQHLPAMYTKFHSSPPMHNNSPGSPHLRANIFHLTPDCENGKWSFCYTAMPIIFRNENVNHKPRLSRP